MINLIIFGCDKWRKECTCEKGCFNKIASIGQNPIEFIRLAYNIEFCKSYIFLEIYVGLRKP